MYVCFPSEMNEMTEDHFLLGHGYGGPMHEQYCYDIVLNNQAIFNFLSTCFIQMLGFMSVYC